MSIIGSCFGITLAKLVLSSHKNRLLAILFSLRISITLVCSTAAHFPRNQVFWLLCSERRFRTLSLLGAFDVPHMILSLWVHLTLLILSLCDTQCILFLSFKCIMLETIDEILLVESSHHVLLPVLANVLLPCTFLFLSMNLKLQKHYISMQSFFKTKNYISINKLCGIALKGWSYNYNYRQTLATVALHSSILIVRMVLVWEINERKTDRI